MKTNKTIMKMALSGLIGLICLLGASCSLTREVRPISVTETTVLDIGDGGLLSTIPCGPPCFFGIIPGETTKSDAIKLLHTNVIDQGCTEFDNTSGGGVYGITCDVAVITLDSQSNTVTAIGFDPSHIITVKEVLEKYGEPDTILVGLVSPSGKQFTSEMSLFYDRINVILGLSGQNSNEFKLEPDTLVTGIQYVDSDEYQLRRKNFQNWNGYGIYHP